MRGMKEGPIESIDLIIIRSYVDNFMYTEEFILFCMIFMLLVTQKMLRKHAGKSVFL